MGVPVLAEAVLTATLVAVLPVYQEPFADCVAQRESRGVADVVSASGTYHGKYQFNDSAWRRGLAHDVARAINKHVGASDWRAVRAYLRSMPISQWPETYQDVAFGVALNASGPYSGAGHWAGAGCGRHIRGVVK